MCSASEHRALPAPARSWPVMELLHAHLPFPETHAACCSPHPAHWAAAAGSPQTLHLSGARRNHRNHWDLRSSRCMSQAFPSFDFFLSSCLLWAPPPSHAEPGGCNFHSVHTQARSHEPRNPFLLSNNYLSLENRVNTRHLLSTSTIQPSPLRLRHWGTFYPTPPHLCSLCASATAFQNPGVNRQTWEQSKHQESGLDLSGSLKGKSNPLLSCCGAVCTHTPCGASLHTSS